MKDAAYKWIELVLKNWAVILPILLFMGSAVGWSFSAVDNTEKDELTESMKEQIEVLVDYKPRAAPKVGARRCNCNAIFSNLIKKHVKQHKEDH